VAQIAPTFSDYNVIDVSNFALVNLYRPQCLGGGEVLKASKIPLKTRPYGFFITRVLIGGSSFAPILNKSIRLELDHLGTGGVDEPYPFRATGLASLEVQSSALWPIAEPLERWRQGKLLLGLGKPISNALPEKAEMHGLKFGQR